jgi:hypothetical protein
VWPGGCWGVGGFEMFRVCCPIPFLVFGGPWWGWVVVVRVCCWWWGVLLVMFALVSVTSGTTGGMPRRVGVYIRITVAVWFHSFCS